MDSFVQKIVVRTDDFQLAYRIMHMLRSRNIDVEQRSLSEALPTKDAIWIGTVDEIAKKSSEGRPIAADLESIDLAVEAAIFCLERFIQNAPIDHWYRYWASPWYRLVYRWRSHRYETN